MSVLHKIREYGKTVKELTKKEIKTLVTSSPISNLREATVLMRNEIRNKIPLYDSITAGFSNIPEVYDHAAEVIGEKVTEIRGVIEDKISITEDSAKTLVSGILQAMKEEHSNMIAFVDKDGITYQLSVAKEYVDAKFDEIKELPNIYMETAGGQVALLEKGLDGYTLNQVLVGTEYCEQVINDVTSIKGLLYSIYFLCFKELPASTATLAELAAAIELYLGKSTPSNTLFASVRWINLHYNLEAPETIVSGLRSIFKHIRPYRDYRAPITYAIDSMVDTNEINDAYDNLCTAILSSKPYEHLQLLKSQAEQKKDCVKKVYNNAISYWQLNGIRGLVNLVISYFRGGDSISDDSGRLIFTDNSGTLPAEFIAGFITTALSSLASILAVILAVFGRVLGVVLSVIGAVLAKIWSSVISQKDDIYASIRTISDDQSDSIVTIPCMPYASFSGELVISDSERNPNPDVYADWNFESFLYAAYINADKNVCYVSVPGGVLFIGPGSFDDSGVVTSMRYELHPLAIKVNLFGDSVLTSQFRNQYMSEFVRETGYGDDKYYTPSASLTYSKSKEDVYTIWSALIDPENGYVNDIFVNEDTGHLSAANDKLLRQSSNFGVGMFLLWLLSGSSAVPNNYTTVTMGFSKSIVSENWNALANEYLSWCLTLACCGKSVATNDEFPSLDSWSSCISACTFTASNRDYHFYICYSNETSTVTEGGHVQVAESSAYMSEIRQYDFDSLNNGAAFWWYFITGNVLPCPDQFYYDVTMPKYNASTFWSWVALGAVVSAGLAVGAAVATVKFKQFCKKKRAINKHKFDNAQSTYNDALDGVRKEIEFNPETGKYEERIYKFDPNSEYGQNYIASTWKEYRTTARSNNIWSHIIGGSKYDVSSFWGEKVEDDTSESVSYSEKLSSILSYNEEQSSEQVRATSQLAIEDKISSDNAILRTAVNDSTVSMINQVISSSSATSSEVIAAVGHEVLAAANDVNENISRIEIIITGRSSQVITPEK